MSQSGAFLWGCQSGGIRGHVIFKIRGKKPINKYCTVTRRSDTNEKWMAVNFTEPLSEFELDRIKIKPEKLFLCGDVTTYDLAKIDRAEVFRETNQIKTCSSNYFIWSVGLIVPFTLAIWALALQASLTAVAASGSIFGIVIVFSVAVSSNLEKVRAINKREGFIAALDYYLRNAQGPSNYRGWVNLKHCFAECGTRRRASLCPLDLGPKSGGTCRNIGKEKAARIRLAKKIFPSVIDSFVSLTSCVYSLLFVFLVVITIYSFKNTWLALYNIPAATTLWWFFGGFIGSAILWRHKVIIVGVVIGGVASLTAGVVLTWPILINFVSCGLGIMLGTVALFFLRQLIALRIGRHSFETLTHMWLEIFENCVFLPEDSESKNGIAVPLTWKDKVSNMFITYLHR